LLFTLIYAAVGDVERIPYPGSKHEFTFRLRLLDFPKDYYRQRFDKTRNSTDRDQHRQTEHEQFNGDTHKSARSAVKNGRKFINALRFSSVLIYKVGYRDTTISGRLGKFDLKYLVVLQWVLGFFLLAALMITLANTQPLINRLITGAF
jgi:hypothetical protein